MFLSYILSITIHDDHTTQRTSRPFIVHRPAVIGLRISYSGYRTLAFALAFAFALQDHQVVRLALRCVTWVI